MSLSDLDLVFQATSSERAPAQPDQSTVQPPDTGAGSSNPTSNQAPDSATPTRQGGPSTARPSDASASAASAVIDADEATLSSLLASLSAIDPDDPNLDIEALLREMEGADLAAGEIEGRLDRFLGVLRGMEGDLLDAPEGEGAGAGAEEGGVEDDIAEAGGEDGEAIAGEGAGAGARPEDGRQGGEAGKIAFGGEGDAAEGGER